MKKRQHFDNQKVGKYVWVQHGFTPNKRLLLFSFIISKDIQY